MLEGRGDLGSDPRVSAHRPNDPRAAGQPNNKGRDYSATLKAPAEASGMAQRGPFTEISPAAPPSEAFIPMSSGGNGNAAFDGSGSRKQTFETYPGSGRYGGTAGDGSPVTGYGPGPGAGGTSADANTSYWNALKSRAYDQARAQLNKASATRDREITDAGDNILEARAGWNDLVTQAKLSPVSTTASRAWALMRMVDSGPAAKWAARAVVCAYYVNLAVSDVETWLHVRNAPPRRRWPGEEPAGPLAFPWMSVLLVLPAALLAAAGLMVPLCAGLLLAQTLYEDALLTCRQLSVVVTGSGRPTELLTKRLAMAGVVLLVLAHSFKDTGGGAMRTYAGLLLGGGEGRTQRPSARKSALLLAGRCLLACLLLFAGAMQVRRIGAREGNLWAASTPTPRQAAAAQQAAAAEDTSATIRTPSMNVRLTHQHYGIPDSHDNNWQLLQLVLVVPFVLGWKVDGVCRALAVVLVLEALTCWPWWAWYWPSWHYRQHVRLHFFTNWAIAGGAVLLQCLGAGRFTVDSLIKQE